jgi:hypothetical protein
MEMAFEERGRADDQEANLSHQPALDEPKRRSSDPLRQHQPVDVEAFVDKRRCADEPATKRPADGKHLQIPR